MKETTKSALEIVNHEMQKNVGYPYASDDLKEKNMIYSRMSCDEMISKIVDDYLTGKDDRLFDMDYFKNIYDSAKNYSTFSMYAALEFRKMEDSIVMNIERVSDRKYMVDGKEFYYDTRVQLVIHNNGLITGIKSKDFFEYYPYNKERWEILEDYLTKTMKYCNESSRNM